MCSAEEKNGKEIWDSDSSTDESHSDGCKSYPNGTVMLGKNVAIIKDNEEGVLRTDSFREYLERVEEFDDLRAMFITMILDLKERVKGCEHCETCSQVIELVEINVRMCKTISKLAHGFANVFMYIIKRAIPNKLSENTKNLLNVAFILLVKNSKFVDIQFIRDKFKAFINVNAFEGLALRLAIQKYKPAEIRIMLLEWGCDPAVRAHRPIIRAFYYEKFGIVRTLIELGSSYKYYLQEDLPAVEYNAFQKAIDKYLAVKLPDATPIEKELHIVGMINNFRHLMLVDGDDDSDNEYNPISSEFFLEEFMQYFYETTGISAEKKKKKKKKKNKKKKKSSQPEEGGQEAAPVPKSDTNELEPSIVGTESNDYDLLNDETFNLEGGDIGDYIKADANIFGGFEEEEEASPETILLDSYYSNHTSAKARLNQNHLGNWRPACSLESNLVWDYWYNHFRDVFREYSN